MKKRYGLRACCGRFTRTKGHGQPGDDPDHRRDRLADLDLPHQKCGWPKIKEYFNKGMSDLQDGRDAAPGQ